MRPLLAPAARRVWRDTSTVQFGLTAGPRLLLAGVDDGVRRMLPLLDGLRTREEVIGQARDRGCQDPVGALKVLHDSGLLVDADEFRALGLERDDRDRLAPEVSSLTLLHGSQAPAALRARRAARVVIFGAGRVGAPLAALLSAAGVGTVDVRDPDSVRLQDLQVGGLLPGDIGRKRDEAVHARLRSDGSVKVPSLVILTDEVAPELTGALLRDGVPHLRVLAGGDLGVVGPLVLPGATPCLRCLELVRASIDPAWAALLAQPDNRPHADEGPDGMLAAAVAAHAGLQVLQHVEGLEPASLGGTLELRLPGWQWRRRTWPRHPACTCAVLSAAAAPLSGADGGLLATG